MSEIIVADEILARSIVIVDEEGRPRIRLEVAGNGAAEIVVSDEVGAFVSVEAGELGALGVRVDDGRRACDVTTGGLEVAVVEDDKRACIAAMEERTERLEQLVRRMVDGRGE